MRLFTEPDYERVREFSEYADRYYRNRLDYLSTVGSLVAASGVQSTIELGAFLLPINLEGDVIDKSAFVLDYIKKTFPVGVTFNFDASLTPWPIASDSYDLFIGLQVFEHLEGNQVAAFNEVRRIARRAILSFPYLWNCPHDPVHHMIGADVISAWTSAAKATHTIDKGQAMKRRIVMFDFGK